MTAPVASARLTPTGKKLGNGWQTTVTLSLAPHIALWEDEITPSGFEMPAAIETSSQLNNDWETFHPPHLKKSTDITVKGRYDPSVLLALAALAGRQQTVTTTYPTGATLAQYGYVSAATPGSLIRNQKPDITVKIVITNADPVTCEEEGPVYTAGTGTACY